MADTETRPTSQPVLPPDTLEEARPGKGSKTCAAGAGVIGAVCCGGGLAALVATLIGAVGAAQFMRSWVHMQGITLISSTAAVLAVLGLALVITRRARSGLAPKERRRVYGRALLRLGGWALLGYFGWVVVVGSVLALVGFEYPRG